MNRLKNNLSMRLIDLSLVVMFVVICYIGVYCVKLLIALNTPFCVTYSASRTSLPCELCITYRDSIGMMTCYTKNENWSRQVCLPAGTSAFLLVQAVYSDSAYRENIMDYLWIGEFPNDVLAKITSGTSGTCFRGKGYVVVGYSLPVIR